MPADEPTPRLLLMPMPQLAQAESREDDWTGLADPASRRKIQNRLNVRAYRRRKALESQPYPIIRYPPKSHGIKAEQGIPCWVEDQQAVVLFPDSSTSGLHRRSAPLIPRAPGPATASQRQSAPDTIVFPLAPDHLITLLQYNVLRACIANRRLLSPILNPVDDCSAAALHVLPALPFPPRIPPSLYPTLLQRTIQHEGWIDIIPHPTWRDNLIRAVGHFDEDELWADTIGGLFEGFPHSEIERRGVIAWSPPWHPTGWELSEGFWRKWRWSFKGCEDLLEATNRWRALRGEPALTWSSSS